MDQKITWSLIIAGVVVIAGAAIWGIWSLLKGSDKSETNDKLERDLNKIVEKASAKAVNEFVDNKSKAFTGSDAKVAQIINSQTITIVKADITARRDVIKENYKDADKTNIGKVDGSETGAPTALTAISEKVTAALKDKAKKIAEELISIKIREKVSWQSEKAAKSATDDKVCDLVEKGSSVDTTAKDNISNAAKTAADAEIKKIVSDIVLSAIEISVVAEGRDVLRVSLDKMKEEIMDEAILKAAGVTKK